MNIETQPDLRLAPDARVGWSIPKQEWDEHVRARKRFVGTTIFYALSCVTLYSSMAATFLIFAQSLWVNYGHRVSDGFGLLIIAAFACVLLRIAYLLRGIPPLNAFALVGKIIAYRRRGDLVWERGGCVCPTCLKPFDDAGRATCRHRVAAFQQPTIIRLLEAEVLEDDIDRSALAKTLADEARLRGVPVRGWSPLRRFSADELDAWPKHVRVLARVAYRAIAWAVLWIAMGWSLVAWVPSVYIRSWSARYFNRFERLGSRSVVCTKCKYVIHDLAKTSFCTECGSDLSKTGSVRTEGGKLLASPAGHPYFFPVALAFVWGVILAPRALWLVPAPVLTAAIDCSIGPARGFISALGYRTLSQDENAAATAAILAWSTRDPFGFPVKEPSAATVAPSIGDTLLSFVFDPPLDFHVVPTAETLATLDDDALEILLASVPQPLWLATTARGWPSIGLRPDARIAQGADVVVEVTGGLPRKASAIPVLFVIEVSEITATRASDGTSIASSIPLAPRSVDLFGMQACLVGAKFALANLEPGQYELRANYTVKLLPPTAPGMSASPTTIQQAKDLPVKLTTPISTRVIIE